MKNILSRSYQVLALALTIILAIYGLSWGYLVYEARRASRFLDDTKAIKLGDPESAIVALSKKYKGYKWESEAIGKLEQQERAEYAYVLTVDPWRFWPQPPPGRPGTLDRIIRYASTELAPGVRRILGLRRWSVIADVMIRNNRVSAVVCTATVEGRDEWLGGTWNLSQEIPSPVVQHSVVNSDVSSPQTNRYVVGLRSLKFSKADGSGESVESWITPSATQDEREAATGMNLECLTSRVGCRTVCDFVPGAVEYVKRGTWEERKKACTPPRAYGYR